MLSKNELKYYSSLLVKKFRGEENKFIVEGKKIIEEALQSKFKCELIFVTKEFAKKEKRYLNTIPNEIRIEELNNAEFKKLKSTVSPQGIAAVFSKAIKSIKDIVEAKKNPLVCLDNISDPGNLGTILRNCDWFGFQDILLTENCTELFSPKTIRASMGSVFHLNIREDISLTDITNLKKKGYKIFCADLNGENLYSINFENNSILVFSNEANGPSPEILNLSDKKITIPSYGKAESLNVASASAVILSQIRKKII